MILSASLTMFSETLRSSIPSEKDDWQHESEETRNGCESSFEEEKLTGLAADQFFFKL
jgi:hypothetical protein